MGQLDQKLQSSFNGKYRRNGAQLERGDLKYIEEADALEVVENSGRARASSVSSGPAILENVLQHSASLEQYLLL